MPGAKRGRKPGSPMTEAHRDKIRNSKILQVLIAHVEGRQKMSSSQVTAGLGLLKKVMPDMTEAEVRGSGDNGEHEIVLSWRSSK